MSNGSVNATDQQEFSDADWRAVATGDQSKKLKFDLSGLTTGTTYTWTVSASALTFLGTSTSANLRALLSDETGSGSA